MRGPRPFPAALRATIGEQAGDTVTISLTERIARTPVR